MINPIIKPNSRKVDNKWIPEGMVSFINGRNLTERKEWCENVKFNTKEEADQYFIQKCKEKYKIMG